MRVSEATSVTHEDENHRHIFVHRRIERLKVELMTDRDQQEEVTSNN